MGLPTQPNHRRLIVICPSVCQLILAFFVSISAQQLYWFVSGKSPVRPYPSHPCLPSFGSLVKLLLLWTVLQAGKSLLPEQTVSEELVHLSQCHIHRGCRSDQGAQLVAAAQNIGKQKTHWRRSWLYKRWWKSYESRTIKKALSDLNQSIITFGVTLCISVLSVIFRSLCMIFPLSHSTCASTMGAGSRN